MVVWGRGGGGALLGCCSWIVSYRLAAHKYVLLAHGHKVLPNERSVWRKSLRDRRIERYLKVFKL